LKEAVIRSFCVARWTLALGAAFALVAVGAGCSGAGVDKAGNERRQKPRVLITPNGVLFPDPDNANLIPTEVQRFADAVSRLSSGKLRVNFREGGWEARKNSELSIIRDVQRDKIDFGWVGSRAWDAVGVTSFDALNAPLLIDSYALEGKVMSSAIPGEMLKGLSSLGLVGLGVLPGPMEKPLGVAKALVVPSDFRGLKIGITRSQIARETLRALGAEAKPLPSGGLGPVTGLRGLDGVATNANGIYSTNYDLVAKYLSVSANINLWPRPIVLFTSKKAFASLAPAERAWLRQAARDAIPRALVALRAKDREAVSGLCSRGVKLVTAAAADLVRLREAVAPVYAHLEREPETRSFIKSITQMRARLPGAAEPPTCSTRLRRSAGAIPNGSYAVTITREDARRGGLSPQDDLSQLREKRFRLVLNAGAFVLYEVHPNRRAEVGFAGRYSVYRDRIDVIGDNGDQLTARWSFDGERLRFELPVKGDYGVVWGSHPWVRIG
jgi:TRAP-type C4-dicarboxylate transport system substrate-binding protein